MKNMRWKDDSLATAVLALMLGSYTALWPLSSVAAASQLGLPFSSNPAPGPVACDGMPSSTARRTIVITNTGSATLNISGCAFSSGVEFSVVSGPPMSLAPGASGNVDIDCSVPQMGNPAVYDTLICSHDAPGSPVSYAFSSFGGAASLLPIPADRIPASSPLSKLLLFGLLAGLCAAVILSRRR